MLCGQRYAPAAQAGILFLAVVLGAALRPAPLAAAPADIGRSVPLPANESETVLRRWLSEKGYEVSRAGTTAGGARLLARRGNESWEIVIVPDSPLASRVRAGFAKEGKCDPSAAAAVREHLDRYVKGNGGSGEAGGLGPVPAVVRERVAAVVCLSASRQGGEPIRFSGLVVDGSGSVVSTAHDLGGVDKVTVYGDGGVEAAGRLVRRDAVRDLSLIRVQGGMPAKVPLAAARDVMSEGESVYSIGCPGDTRPMIRAGFVSGAPRKANGMPLWPVEMETLPGSSGGPVFDGAGKLVGVVKGRYRGTESQGFVIPVRTIVEFLREAHAP